MNTFRGRAKYRRDMLCFDAPGILTAYIQDNKLFDEYLAVEIHKWKPRRSLPQNALFHALCSEISRLTGMDADLIKEGIKDQYGPRMRWHDRLVVKPSHLCDAEEMGELIRGAEVELADAGGDPRAVE